jgi:putative selenium metabolism protein SsnA
MAKAKKKTSALALTGALLVEQSPPRVRSGVIVIEEGRVAAVAEKAPDGAETLDCEGRLVVPGFVCAHTHLYSALARGMPPAREAPLSFAQILERVWWKLDRALDEESLRASALVGAIEAARAGTTTLVDHHASPSFIDGSLDVVGAALEEVGLRGVLAYEVSERNGAAEAKAGLRENDRFLERITREPRPLLRGLVGAHAAFTLSDATADALADVIARHGSGLHIHLAEDSIDEKKEGWITSDWLRERGLLGPRTLLAHGVHIEDLAVKRIVESGAHVVHNPRSNANNRVGYARPSRYGGQLLLGTDGIGADMRAEAHAAFLAAREHGDSVDVAAALERNRTFAAFQFGEAIGRMEAGAPADLAVLDYRAPTPLEPHNLAGHLLFGVQGAPVRHLLVDGRVVVRDGALTTVDEAAVFARAREAAAKLWRRMNA